MISNIRRALELKKGHNVVIYVDIGRNKVERYEGKIIDVYKYVWTFKTSTELKSFSYSDILSKFVIINSLYW